MANKWAISKWLAIRSLTTTHYVIGIQSRFTYNVWRLSLETFLSRLDFPGWEWGTQRLPFVRLLQVKWSEVAPKRFQISVRRHTRDIWTCKEQNYFLPISKRKIWYQVWTKWHSTLNFKNDPLKVFSSLSGFHCVVICGRSK